MSLKELINEVNEARTISYNNQDWEAYKIATNQLGELLREAIK